MVKLCILEVMYQAQIVLLLKSVVRLMARLIVVQLLRLDKISPERNTVSKLKILLWIPALFIMRPIQQYNIILLL